MKGKAEGGGFAAAWTLMDRPLQVASQLLWLNVWGVAMLFGCATAQRVLQRCRQCLWQWKIRGRTPEDYICRGDGSCTGIGVNGCFSLLEHFVCILIAGSHHKSHGYYPRKLDVPRVFIVAPVLTLLNASLMSLPARRNSTLQSKRSMTQYTHR